MLNIPFPFALQGATPIHVYDDVIFSTEHGETCLTPEGEIANFKVGEVSFIGGVLTIEDVPLGDDGFIYLNVHLDYDLKRQTGWAKGDVDGDGGEDAVDNSNVAGIQPTIKEGTEYAFSAEVDGAGLVGSEDSVFNDNIFRNIRGAGALMTDEAGNPLAKQNVDIFQGKTWLGEVTTDEHGWGFFEFMATGKKTDYSIVWDRNDNDRIEAGDWAKTMQMGGNAGKYALAEFTLDDRGTYDALAGDHTIESYTVIA